MIVGFGLGDKKQFPPLRLINIVAVGREVIAFAAANHRGIVGEGGNDSGRIGGMGLANEFH